jgi:hypothetical protein
MQFRKLTALIVFLGSYLPLSLILLAQNADYSQLSKGFCWPLTTAQCGLPLRNPAWAIGMFSLTFVCFLATLVALSLVRPRKQIEVVELKYIPTDLMNYTLPYIVSFMSIDYQDTGKFIGFAVFLAWMFWISYKSGQIVMNPVLIALGWRLYDVGYMFAGGTTKHAGRALVKGHLSQGPHKQSQLQDILIIKPGT